MFFESMKPRKIWSKIPANTLSDVLQHLNSFFAASFSLQRPRGATTPTSVSCFCFLFRKGHHCGNKLFPASVSVILTENPSLTDRPLLDFFLFCTASPFYPWSKNARFSFARLQTGTSSNHVTRITELNAMCFSTGNLWAFDSGSRTAMCGKICHHALGAHTPTAYCAAFSLFSCPTSEVTMEFEIWIDEQKSEFGN